MRAATPSSIDINTFRVKNAVLLYFRNGRQPKIAESTIFDRIRPTLKA
jgi:hypothetical protein